MEPVFSKPPWSPQSLGARDSVAASIRFFARSFVINLARNAHDDAAVLAALEAGLAPARRGLVARVAVDAMRVALPDLQLSR